MMESELSSTTIKLTRHNLPLGIFWEEDGSAWSASITNHQVEGCDWRWRPLNWKAFAKERPDGEMTDSPIRAISLPDNIEGETSVG